jgi:methylated-DNA-[protein]-cysteine S-methyltransferase
MNESTENETLEIPSPIGPLALEARDGLLVAVRFDGRVGGEPAESSSELATAALQLAEYFSGERRAFELPLAQPRPAFDREVLSVVGEIPYGERTSYGQVTATLGLGRDQVRKAAAAIGRNPLPILVPCHRVVGADGSLTGYGGGLERKAQLLALEAGQPQLATPA